MDGGNWNKILNSIQNREGNTFIQSRLDAGLDVNAKYDQTMLSYAAQCGNLEVIEFLLQKGADVNVTNSNGSKPLHIAAVYGHKGIVKLFLNLGVFVDSCDNSKCTPLHYVAGKSYIPAHARESYQELVHILLDNNANLNAVSRSGCTPLLFAAKNGCKYTVELFIKLGANVECCDQDQWTVLHYSCRNGWPGAVRSLVEGRCGINLNCRNADCNTPLIIAAESLHEDVVKLLIEYGANVKCQDYENRTVMLHSCREGWLDVVKLLVSKKCDLNAKYSTGNTPLIIAADRSRKDVVKLLIESGANINCKGFKDKTVLHHVCEQGWLDVVESLINKGCNLSAKDSRGDTPLLLAAFYSHCSVVDYLIESGADVECCNNDGRTVLHFACREGWLDTVKSLVKKGSDLNARNGTSDTFLHLAVRSHKLEVIEHLLKARADCNVKNYCGKTAFNDFVQNLPCLDGIILFIESGAYFQYDDYVAISENPLLKVGVLQDMKLCTQAVMNKFNYGDLPRIYELPVVSKSLPSMEKLKIANNTKVAQDIAQSVNYEIQAKGYCNVSNAHPIALSILSVRSLVEHLKLVPY